MNYVGYEIHMGRTQYEESYKGNVCEKAVITGERENIYGSYVHGLFDCGNIASVIVGALGKKKGISMENLSCMNYQSFKEKQYDKLADTLREYLNMEEIYGMLREAHME